MPYNRFLEGGGEMGELIRTYNWEQTSLGVPKMWPVSLLSTISILLNSRYPMFLYWGSDHICFYNDAYRPSLGNTGKHPAVGKRGQDVWPETWKQTEPLLKKVLETGESTWDEDTLMPIFRNGKMEDVYWTLSYSPIKNEFGYKEGVLVICQETTEKVKSRRLIAESELRLRSIVDNATIGICLTSGRKMIVESMNERMKEIIHTNDNVIGKMLTDVVPEIKGSPLLNILNKVYKNGEVFKQAEFPGILKLDGNPENRFYNLSYIPLKANGSVKYILHLAIDVTQQVVARKKIETAETNARLAIESAEMGTYATNLKTYEIHTSARFRQIWDIEDENLNREKLAATFHPEDLPVRDKAQREALKTGKLHYEARIFRKDGSMHWIRVNGKVLYEEDKTPVYMIGVIQDITDQKNIQQQKDNFMAMANHELKTPLTSIKAYTQLIEIMLKDRGAPEEVQMISKMDRQINRLTNLVSDLLSINNLNAGRLVFNRSVFDLNELILERVEELQSTTKQHRINAKLKQTQNVFADREKVGQVINNLIANAIKYSPDATKINIYNRTESEDIIVFVQDFGIGINKDEQESIFEQFYRSNDRKHQTFPGFGLGLYIAADIIKKEGGRIWVNSAVGEGSTFCFSLPAATATNSYRKVYSSLN